MIRLGELSHPQVIKVTLARLRDSRYLSIIEVHWSLVQFKVLQNVLLE